MHTNRNDLHEKNITKGYERDHCLENGRHKIYVDVDMFINIYKEFNMQQERMTK